MSEVNEIPTGWAEIQIKDAFDFVGGGTPSKQNSDYWNGDLNWASVKDIKGEYLSDTEDKITIVGAENSATNIALPGDVILITRINPGRTIITKINTAINQDLKIIKPKFETNSNFIRYFFASIERQCINLSSGTTVLGITLNNLNEIKMLLPPLKEQHRIVAKLEELFSSLDKGIESLKTAKEQLKVYRQAVLKWAFEGKLSKPFRIKHISSTSTKEELNSIRKERELWFKSVGKKLKYDFAINDETLTDIPLEWSWVKIYETVFNTADDIVDGPFGSNLKNSDYVEGAPIPVISISNIEEGFDKKIRYITKEKFETIKRSAVHPGDIIVAKIGSTYGKTGVYPETMPVGVIPANLLRIHPSKHYNKKLLVYYLKSLVFKKRLDRIMKSTAQPAFNVSMFKELPIPFMGAKEQEYLVLEIENRLSICDKIEESINFSLLQSEALRQSILKKAFEGKLVPQDPNDEPALELLKRIKAEVENNKPVKKEKDKKAIGTKFKKETLSA